MKVFVLFLIPFAACVGMTPLPSTSSSSSAQRASGADMSGQITMPDVFKLPRDQATAALRRAGVEGEIHEEASLCGTIVNGRIVETGEVCEQQPAAGRQQGARLSVTVRFQTEDPRHGNAGKPTEWRLMPNLVGLTFEQALVAMRRAGYVEDERLQQVWADETSCKPSLVCRQYPEANARAGLQDGKAVYMGPDRNAKPVVANTEPSLPTAGSAPVATPAPSAPSAGAAKHWGGDGSPAHRDADNRPHGPGGGVFMGKTEPCTNKHDHCLRPGVLFASDGAIPGKMFRATPVFELEGKWWTWRGEPATYKFLFKTKVAEKISDLAVGKPIVWLVQQNANEQWLDNEYESLTSSR